jgi:hypothetical protein
LGVSRGRALIRPTSAIVVAVLGTGLLSACSSAPPTAADFCRTLAQQEAQYLHSYGHASSTDPLADLVEALSAIGQWVPIFQALQQSSPPSIEPQVASIVASLQQQQQGSAASNPLGALFSGLMSGLESSGSWQQVSSYAAAHCGSGDSGS